jgi:hypothetical protein
VNSQTNVDDVSMYLKFGHKSITLIMSVPNDGYFRNASCAPNSISTFLLQSRCEDTTDPIDMIRLGELL